ncbi:hypothetical protein TpMuguga_04g00372 [Theileria parva strain Muguga]|uniref:Uncharacterized protein n=1 Tax=Theileria parva TaxID=5875 RepID=Q4N2H7_THEPA|nr:uncharacterized protein TpMuguga_04g00372 [Theileria parva strain Muguga]EAN31724.1 hypothetical protein TpMuguga_04g00372 [Theileria parva strain Muguga]|eukprot:XP_764007.1 hypothetical protein [Theileria parva strain Muguga]
MNRFDNRVHQTEHQDLEDDVVGEILEDIECLNLSDSEVEDTDLLNDDTFGAIEDSHWDPTETFLEAERQKNAPKRRTRPANADLQKFSDFDILLKQPYQYRRKRDLNFKRRDGQRRNHSPSPHEDTTEPEERIWEDDLEKIKSFCLFEITPEHVDQLANKTVKLSDRFKLSQRTIERHVRCVDRNDRTYERELFMTPNEFDKILRIQLAQVSKDPKLQSYTGKWNLYHLGVKKGPRREETTDGQNETKHDESDNLKQQKEDKSDNEDDSKFANDDNKPDDTKVLKSRAARFGKASTASIRHGRKLIYLGADVSNTSRSENAPDICMDKQVRKTIETCYETLYVLCDVENEIEKCPMNHVSALDKMQKDRDEYLRDLFSMLTGDDEVFRGILGLNKGRLLAAKIGRKFGIENKLLLICSIINSLDRFVEICQNVDKALENIFDLSDFITLVTNPHELKSLVAFENTSDSISLTTNGERIQTVLYAFNSYTRLYLFAIEGITLTGHLFLLTGNKGRHTALQRCSNILISFQQKCRGFERILTTRSGVVFINIFLQRIRTNAGAVDQNTVDIILHYTLDISEHIESNQNEWNSLASNIVKMF